MSLTEEQINALDTVVLEVTEFIEMCIEQETGLDGLTKNYLTSFILLKCLRNELKSKDEVLSITLNF